MLFFLCRFAPVTAVVVILGISGGALADRASLLIAPNIAGQEYCPAAAENPEIVTDQAAAEYCARHNQNSSARIAAFLDGIGPVTSPSGHFQLGYSLDLPLMRYYKKSGGVWALDRAAIRTRVRTIAEVSRPVVVYLSANHFTDGGPELSEELAANPANLMWTKNGPLASDGYYIVSVHAWTLSDFGAPITMMREKAARTVIDELCRLAPTARSRIAGISLLGEVQQLYPDFTGDLGYAKPFDVTDYAPKAIIGFRGWLKEKFGQIRAFNATVGANFKTFDEISPPSKDIKNEMQPSVLEHIDAYASGTVAVHGWAYDSAGGQVDIEVYLDGKRRGTVPADLNRTDVPESNPAIKTPNVGWHYDLDYRAEQAGIHSLDIVATLPGHSPVHLASQKIVVLDRARGTPAELATTPVFGDDPQNAPNLQFYVDGPQPLTPLLYNPLARLWLEYRSVIVTRYIEHFARLTRGSCLPPDIVFSHQMMPELNASWNPDLMAVAGSQKPNALYQPGTTLYGGSTFGRAFFDWKAAEGWKRYAVPEFHPRVELSRDQIVRMFEDHRANGAVSISPYYLSIVPKRMEAIGNEISRTLISPENHALGSDAFYAGIVDTINRH